MNGTSDGRAAPAWRSLLELLDGPDGSPRSGDGLAVHGADRSLSWDELRAGAEAFADLVRAAGATPGTAVAVRRSSGPDLVVAVFGTWMAGAVFVPLNPRATPTEVEGILQRVRPAVVVDGDGATPRSDPEERDPDVALITFTSGTTGPPEPVLQRHSGVLDMFEPVLAGIRSSRSGDGGPRSGGGERSAPGGERRAPMPNLVPVPLSLWAGLYNVLFAFRVGAPAVLMDGFDTREFARLVADFGIRSTVLPPAAMVLLSDDESLTGLEPLRFVRSITAPLSPLQARRFRDRFGVTVLNGYGQTEFGGEIAGWSAADAREFGDTHLGAAGRIHRGVEVEVRDTERAPVAAGDEGELWVRTPAVAAAVAAGTAPADRVDADGWLRSGDLVRLDAEGFLWIEGRVSDAINRGGLKVHPGEVEEVLRLSPQVADAAVAAVADDRLGEVPWAFVVPAVDAGGDPDPDALEALCRERLAPYKIPVRFVTVTELPRSEVGKVLRRQLVARAADA
jgi:acyl-CoA synthetase (AMP-forming)/AMP-acid ligase II